MIKRLRIRMIASAILAFSLVIIFISVLVNVVNYRIVTGRADDTLLSISKFEREDFGDRPGERPDPDRKPPIPPFMGMSNPEAQFITRFFIVKYDNDGKITEVAADNISAEAREKAEDLADEVIRGSSEKGYAGEYRYLKVSDVDDNSVIFLNVIQDRQNLKALGIITIAVALSSLLIVSVLVFIFSGTAIKPIANNIEQQKQFITDAGHELKTPLTSIMTSLDVITIENGEDEWTANIRNQSARMSKLVEKLVALSRLDETKPIGVKEEFSISDFAWEMLEVYQSSAKAKGRMIVAEIEEDLCMTGDKDSIGRMLSVLLDNAVKYAKGEGDTVLKVTGAHNRIMIEVSNPAECDENIDVDRLFDRFYRPDSSRNTDDGGSGIGLAIAKAVAEAHGGKITADCPGGRRMIIRVRL